MTSAYDATSTLATESSAGTLSYISYTFKDADEKYSGDDIPKIDNYKETRQTLAANEIVLTHSTSTYSAYSSIHSDLKRSGSQDEFAFSTAKNSIDTTSPSPDALITSNADFPLISPDEDSFSTADPSGDVKPRYRVRSGTLGEQKLSTLATATDTDHDASTVISDTAEEQSRFFDYGEEPSEYIPPTTPKVGGFGVETAKMEPHKEGMRSAASERVNTIFSADVNLHSPELGDNWGSNFWCVIEQPKGQSFFANPETGECAWAVPAGTFVLPPRPEGQWWELYDEVRKLSYYFHTKTKERQWERPKGFVIPLSAIQESTMGKRFSRLELKGESMAGTGEEYDRDNDGEDMIIRRSQPLPPRQEPRSDKRLNAKGGRSTATGSSHRQRRRSHRPPVPSTDHELNDLWTNRRESRPRVATGLSTIPSSSDLRYTAKLSGKTSKNKGSTQRPRTSNGQDANPQSIPRSRSRRQSIDLDSLSSVEIQQPFRRERDPVKRRLLHAYQEAFLKSDKSASRGDTKSPISMRVNLTPTIVGRKRSMSLDDRNTSTISPAKSAFSYESFAAQKYATHRVGIFRRKCPVDRLMRWQKEPLRNPLLPLESNELRRDAIRIFQVILRYCGDRINPVFWPKVPDATGAPGSRVGSCLKESAGQKKESSGPTIMDEVMWMLGRVTSVKGLRNEALAQLMKQMTANNSEESLHKAWSLLCIFLSFISPSKDFFAPLYDFIRQSGLSQNSDDIKVMTEYCLSKMSSKDNHRIKSISIIDIEAAERAAFHPQVFDRSLEIIMSQQFLTDSEATAPMILPFLTKEMLKRDCLSTVEVFRRPGDSELVQALRRRINQGSYTLQDLFPKYDSFKQSDVEEEVHVLASTLKLWLRELKDPLFPQSLYNDCLKASQDSSALLEICKRLDKIRRSVLVYVVTFLQLFCTPEVEAKTRMNLEAIALVFVPNFLRSPVQDLQLISNNLYYEKLFVENLLRHLPTDLLDSNTIASGTIPGPTVDMQADQESHLLGIGENGAGLAPRSRKASTSRS